MGSSAGDLITGTRGVICVLTQLQPPQGVAHTVGLAHIQADDAKAFELYERASALRCDSAQSSAAGVVGGIGAHRAVRCGGDACNCRHSDACFALGKCYHQGIPTARRRCNPSLSASAEVRKRATGSEAKRAFLRSMQAKAVA